MLAIQYIAHYMSPGLSPNGCYNVSHYTSRLTCHVRTENLSSVFNQLHPSDHHW